MGNQSLVSNESRNRLRGLAKPIALAMGRIGLTPNGITVIGFIGTTIAAAAAAAQWWLAAGILVLLFGIFDLFDGALARATGTASKFGAFLDSTLDRTGENLVLRRDRRRCRLGPCLPRRVPRGARDGLRLGGHLRPRQGRGRGH